MWKYCGLQETNQYFTNCLIFSVLLNLFGWIRSETQYQKSVYQKMPAADPVDNGYGSASCFTSGLLFTSSSNIFVAPHNILWNNYFRNSKYDALLRGQLTGVKRNCWTGWKYLERSVKPYIWTSLWNRNKSRFNKNRNQRIPNSSSVRLCAIWNLQLESILQLSLLSNLFVVW